MPNPIQNAVGSIELGINVLMDTITRQGQEIQRLQAVIKALESKLAEPVVDQATRQAGQGKIEDPTYPDGVENGGEA